MRAASGAFSGLSSTVTRLVPVTFRAGEAITAPSTLTRPSSTIFSASRREHRPARAITLAMRSPSGPGPASSSLSAALPGIAGRGSRRPASVAGLQPDGARSPFFFFSAKGLSMTDAEAIALALAEAQAAGARGEVPVGAVLLAPDGT